MAFCWRADDDQTLNAGLVALWFFRGFGPVITKEPYIFFIFQVGQDSLSSPRDLHMPNGGRK